MNTPTEFKTTTTPNDLCYALHGLTDAQKSDIRDMGFQSLMSFSIRSIPMGLGRWLLDNYDHQRNELNVGSHVIEITPSKVHDVLGVPMGEILVSEKRNVRKGDIIKNIWRKQSFIRHVIFVKHVIEKLKSCTEGGTLFRLNFLVVFNSIMGETTKSATVNQQFLTSIVNEHSIRNMDWCSYIITCLKRTKARWNGIKEPYNGPLTFLAVLYAHELQLKRGPEKAITPAVQYVNTGFLANLEGPVYDNIQDDNQSNQNVEDQVMLETCIKAVEGQTVVDQNVNVLLDEEYEVQPQIDDGQTAIDQNVNLLQQEEEVQAQLTNHDGQTAIDQSAEGQTTEVQVQANSLDSVLNLKLPIGPPNAHSLSGLSVNLVHCNQLELPRDKKAHIIVIDDDDDVILDPKQEHSVEKVSAGESGMVCVQGYTVKQSSATMLEFILKKHGDIAADCVLKTDSIRSSILETVCEVVKQIQAKDVFEKLEEIEKRVSDAKAINIDVSWIEAHLETVQKRKEDTEMYRLLMKKKADHLLDENVAQINLRKRRAELAAAEERSKEAKRRVELLQLVAKNLTNNFFESKAKLDSWVNDPVI